MPTPPDSDTDSEESNNKTDKKDEQVSERGSDDNYPQVILFVLVFNGCSAWLSEICTSAHLHMTL
jgi:hypothetical protein